MKNDLLHWIRGHRKQIALLVATVFLFFAISEIAYRIYTWSKYRRDTRVYKESLYRLVDDSRLVYVLAPDFRADLPYLWNPDRKFSIETNNTGFRGPDVQPKSENVIRIMFLGDSYPFGWGLSDERETYPRQVEQILREEYPAVEVINAGIPGYNTDMEYRLLLRIGPELNPDVVVLSYVMNDAEPQATVIPSPAQLYRYQWLWLPERLQEGANEMMKRSGLRPFFRVDKHWADPSFDYTKGFQEGSPKWRESKDALTGIRDYCRENEITLFIFVFPDFSRPLGKDYPFEGIRETVLRWCGELELTCHDIMQDFRGRGQSELILPEETHPDARTHREIADIIARELKKSDALKDR